MPDYLRVKQRDTGHELTVTRAMYDFAPDAYDVLDKPATDRGGAPLREKHRTTVAKQAAAKKAVAPRPPNSATPEPVAPAAADPGQSADTEKEH